MKKFLIFGFFLVATLSVLFYFFDVNSSAVWGRCGNPPPPPRTTTYRPPPPPPPPRCGNLNGRTFSYTVTSWPFPRSFCSSGRASPRTPSFPDYGSATTWRCVNRDAVSVSCRAEREEPPKPKCGTNADTFESTIAEWPSDDFCEIGIPRPVPDLPRAGQHITWDCACEYEHHPAAECRMDRELESPWIVSRGGFVHVGNEIKLAMRDVLYKDIDIFPSYNYGDDEGVSLSTELLTLGGATISESDIGWMGQVYYSTGYTKDINHSWYEKLYELAELNDPQGNLWSEIRNENEINLDICADSRQVYFVDGDLEVDPEVFENFANEHLNGCIFVVRNNVNIVEGLYKSAGLDSTDFESPPGYDIVRGFFLADGVIDIPFVDENRDLRDGLKIVGGLFATGSEGQKSIKMGRSLYVHNHKFPALVLFHDVRYMNLAREVFGDIGYIRDVGFKE